MTRALLITYVFPPTGGVGVGRVLKLAKYLPRHGVRPTVLTAKNPSVPLIDRSLLRDVAQDLPVLLARTLEPGYRAKKAAWEASASATAGQRHRWAAAKGRLVSLARQALIPDPQVLWLPDAARVLTPRLLGARRDDVVFITAPPFSMFLLSALLRMRPGTAVVLDYRDEWATLRTSYEMLAGGVVNRIGELFERAVLRCAHVVTTATEAFRQNLLDRYSWLDPQRVVAIPNGYDVDDFPEALPAPPTDRFVLTHAGTVFRLTHPAGLLGAVRRLHEREPTLAKGLEVRFIGRIVDTAAESFAGTESIGVKRIGFIERERVIPELSKSHQVLCILDDTEGTGSIYPAKIFELMKLGRPCLTLAPPGVLSDMARRHHLGEVLPPRDEAAIATHLERQLRAFRNGTYSPHAQPTDIEHYDRRHQAGQFATVFRDAIRFATS